MDGNAPSNPNANNPPPQLAWRAKNPLKLTPLLHDFPTHPKKSLPKFDLGEDIPLYDHFQIFFLVLEGLTVEHEDVVCRLFSHSLKAKATSWYFGLHANSIIDLDTF